MFVFLSEIYVRAAVRARDILHMAACGVLAAVGTLAGAGLELNAGDVIMPGALCAMVPVVRGDVASANFGILGTVSARFV